MKHRIFLTVIAISLIFISSCKKKEVKQLVPDDYKGWAMTATELTYPIPGHESHYRQIFINKIGENVKIEKKNGRVYYDYPRGTIIVKEIYPTLEPKKGDKPISLSVMIKDPDNPLSRDKWLWIVKNLKTGKEKVIDYEFCFDCHANANEPYPYGDGNKNGDFRDYVYFPYRK